MFIRTHDEPDALIRTSSDWETLAATRLDLIVDPMIYRTAEVFLAGPPARQADEPELAWRDRLALAWRPISQNVQELVSFLDLLVYVDHLPMIDYQYTFPLEQFPGHRLQQVCNEACGSRVLSTIRVAEQPYREARDYAIEAMLAAPREASPREASPRGASPRGASPRGASPRGERDSLADRDIEGELTAFDHQWRPPLPEIDPAYAGTDDVPGRAVDTFLYGGALFGVYAKLASTAHLLQGKRARMLGAGTVQGHYATEPDLFAAIDADFAEERGEKFDIPSLPSVLPLLIRSAGSPLELIQAAAALRNTAMAEETRNWRSRLVADWRAGAAVAANVSDDLRRLAERLRVAGEPYGPPRPDVEQFGGGDPVGTISVYLINAIPWNRLWLWTLPNIPGKRHLKLLHRLHRAHSAYAHVPDYLRYVDRVLFRMWARSG
ncbi:hypothetical protein ACIBEJ_33300 [Nonomuraea sp. NPDC050790]|uniref:hypothetical protein n=1 Tax=Nonomuraea sp. NPDC050790 TaxID=3364371 RepID=UPI0037955F38